MTPDIASLCERLRVHADWLEGEVDLACDSQSFREAATALEALSARVVELEGNMETMLRDYSSRSHAYFMEQKRAQAAKAEVARLRELCEWLSCHADNQDMNHADYRVEAALRTRVLVDKRE